MSTAFTGVEFSIPAITRLFSNAYGEGEATSRARNMVEDMNRVGAKPVMQLFEIGQNEKIPLYTLGETEFPLGKVGAKIPDTVKTIGYGLNWGNPYELSQVCEFA